MSDEHLILGELTAERERRQELERLEREEKERAEDLENVVVYVQANFLVDGSLSQWRVFVANHRAARQRDLLHTQVGLVYPGQEFARWLPGYAIEWVENRPQPGMLTEEERKKIERLALEKIRAIENGDFIGTTKETERGEQSEDGND